MKNPILVLLICAEHIIPHEIMKHFMRFYMPIYPRKHPFEHYCVVCGRKYTDDWWNDREITYD